MKAKVLLHSNSSLFGLSPVRKQQLETHPTNSNFTVTNVAESLLQTSSFYPLPCLNRSHILIEINDRNSVKQIHAQILKSPKNWASDDKILYLLTAYLETGDFQSAGLLLFTRFGQKNLYLKLFMEEFKSYRGNPCEILDVFCMLHRKGLCLFNGRNLGLVLNICAGVMDFWLGLEIHALLIKKGLDFDVHVRCALISFYGMCWGAHSANLAFYESLDQDSLLWNTAIMVNLMNEKWEQGLKLFGDMQRSFVKSNISTSIKVLQACAKLQALDEGKQIHGYAVKHALDSNILISNSLINMYMKSCCHESARAVFDLTETRNLSSWNSIISGYAAVGCLDEAWKLFHHMGISHIEPDIVTWNSLLSGHVQDGSFHEVIRILEKLQTASYKPNSRTITVVLQAIRELGYLNPGKEAHCYAIKFGFDHDLHVATSLIDMYVKNDGLKIAKTIFDSMENRNICAWNSLFSGYVLAQNFEEALNLLNHMKKEGISPDLITYNILVSGYSSSGYIQEAKAMIVEIENSGLKPNVVSWTALISGYSQNGYYKDALDCCIEMQKEGVSPNSATFASLLQACAGLSLLMKGKEIHGHRIRNGSVNDAFVITALIDMYCKCGSVKNAYEVFEKFQNKNIACWNSMIAGLASCGLGKEAISLFEKMQEGGIRPDGITFTTLLSSCKNSGLIKEGWKYFDSMERCHGVAPTIEHYSCMVDLLGRAGYLDEAWDFMKAMPLEPDATIWGAILASCKAQGDSKFGEIAARKLFELEPLNPVNYISLMNLYAGLNKWESVDQIKQLMQARGVEIGHVCSWIQIDGRVHIFTAVDYPHPDEGEIHFELYKLISEMKKFGYVPDTACVYQNIDTIEKEKLVLVHTEKLAITYGLIKTRGFAPIRVVKNTRICSDCHVVAKHISMLRRRDIILKEGLRIHHFSNGKCSCNDFW